jgi:hypothetical protein
MAVGASVPMHSRPAPRAYNSVFLIDRHGR